MNSLCNKSITGLMFAYSILCERKLWLYANGLGQEENSEQVKVGKLIDEETFKRESKHILLDDCINIDYIKNGIIYEIKKSKKLKEISKYQIKYYLYHLYKNNIKNPVGILKVPKEKYEEEIYLTDDDIIHIEKQLERINEIISSNKVPPCKEGNICKKCAYYDMCGI